MPQKLQGFQHKNAFFRIHVYLHDFQIESEVENWKRKDLFKQFVTQSSGYVSDIAWRGLHLFEEC